MNAILSAARESSDGARTGPVGVDIPPLIAMADLLQWTPVRHGPVLWRDAFEMHLERHVLAVLAQSEPDRCLEESLTLLAEGARRRFLRAPAVATLLRRQLGNPFDDRVFARLLLAELAAAGIPTELPESLWTARGDRLLEQGEPERWTLTGAPLGDTGIALDLASPFEFPDDEFGIAETAPHGSEELEIAMGKVLEAIEALRLASPPALALVTSLIEVLALRRELPKPTAFYSSTFPGCPGLVRLTNTHLPEASSHAIVEGLVHESIHCILHVHEELEEPFVRKAEDRDTKVRSPWTGATIRLQSYIHACAVWYGIYWLWSADGFAAGPPDGEVETLRQRARRGFQYRPVSVGLAPFRDLITNSIGALLQELEERMLQAG